ncbi:hypothetical protein B0O95_106183 [Mycetohabitans endofungorum]|uniref:Uncharacterized protein n=2 Tax=Burkholderiaceae TaxID=119060 RepID=A0A2P5KAQ2_9BURK|nr:hypothetical protein B0O95_106183 [Mycetohabitans endofungorum]
MRVETNSEKTLSSPQRLSGFRGLSLFGSLWRSVRPDVSSFPLQSLTARGRSRLAAHLILLHERDAQGAWFHPPSGVEPSQADAYVRFDTIARFYARAG